MAVLGWLTFTTLDALPNEVLSIAAQAPASAGYLQQKWEVWQRFSPTGHRLILENLGSALFLAVGILFNMMLGVQQLFESAGRSYQHSMLATVGHWLRLFKSWGFFAASLASLGALMSIYGCFSTFSS